MMKKIFIFFLIISFENFCFAQSGSCSLVPNSKTCVDSTSCKTSSSGQSICLAGITPPTGGLNVSQTCWQYSYTYACAATGSDTVDTCSSYEKDSACTEITSSCVDTIAETGKCDSWQNTYQCQTAAATTTPAVSCASGLFNSSDYPTPTNTNNTFANAAVAAELINEGATYSADSLLFSGKKEDCTKGYMGIKNCCSPSPGGQTNSMVMSTALGAVGSVVKYAGSAAVNYFSGFCYDSMFESGMISESTWLTQLVGSSAPTLGFSEMGFTLGFGAPAAGVTPLIAGNGWYLSFSLGAFAFAIAVMYVQSLASCTQEEQLLAMHRGSNLSYYLNEECTNKVMGECLLWQDNYCSFNSVLAKIINIQGKQQLGMDVSNCSGLTVNQIENINFSKVDFSQFSQQIIEKAEQNLPTNSSLANGYQTTLSNSTSGSTQGGTAANPTY